jgi:hypothetical protein
VAIPNAALRFKPEDKDRVLIPLERGQARVYRKEGPVGAETLAPVVITTGVSDGVWTQLVSTVGEPALLAGFELVTEQTDKVATKRKFLGLF